MPRLTAPSSIKAVHLHAPVGAAYVVFAIIALLHAVVLQWMYSTVGMPYANAVEQNERIQATNSLHMGFSERNLLKLQSGLTRAADLDTFNETLFDDSKSLYRALSKRSDALAKASIGPATRPLAAALDAAIEPHTDGRPYVERKQLKGYLKKLGELSKPKMAAPDAAPEPVDEKEMLSESELSATVEKVKAAIELSRGSEDEVEEEEDEKKLPSKWLPSFWACLAFFGCILVGVITHMGTYWSVAFNAIMYYHPTWAVQVGSCARRAAAASRYRGDRPATSVVLRPALLPTPAPKVRDRDGRRGDREWPRRLVPAAVMPDFVAAKRVCLERWIAECHSDRADL